MQKFKAVLFDMDGILVDSMPYHFISWFETMRKYNIRVTPFEIYGKEGEKSELCVEYFFKKAKRKITKEKIKKITRERAEKFNEYFKPYIFAGVEEIIRGLKKQGYKTAVVTGSAKADAVKILPAKIYNLFDAIISSDIVKKGKPHPEPYLTASNLLNVSPSQCMVVENAPYGVKSAKSAKMYCVAVTTSLPEQYLKQADKICADIKEVFKRSRIGR
ncbi:MAG: HAD family phosphatase [Endomicrobiaceae bacterium]|jgi:beta-phosphoglucomutase|nr:HAD family phosphatase [Endomicrobiaceae bacterium]MDD3729867.1 HAD family phosphatase [Endomicrobiaceae bacterium]MDD4166259.1 HAD family phosphatase [Endomicrobiaceae bacterium]